MVVLWTVILITALTYTYLVIRNINEEKEEAKNLQSQSWAQFGAIIVALSIAMMSYFFNELGNINSLEIEKNKKLKEQKKILKNIEVLKLEVSVASKGQQEELKKDRAPSYFIPTINAFYHISKLDSEINGKETIVLKQILMRMENEIKNINQLVGLAQKAAVIPNPQTYKQFITELKKPKGYYFNLNRLLNSLNEVWIKLEGHM